MRTLLVVLAVAAALISASLGTARGAHAAEPTSLAPLAGPMIVAVERNINKNGYAALNMICAASGACHWLYRNRAYTGTITRTSAPNTYVVRIPRHVCKVMVTTTGGTTGFKQQHCT
jgi:hypothetical protein